MTTDLLTASMLEYLEALRDMLDQEAGKGWPVLHALSSLDAVLRAEQPGSGSYPLDLPRETDYLLDRLAEVRKAHKVKAGERP